MDPQIITPTFSNHTVCPSTCLSYCPTTCLQRLLHPCKYHKIGTQFAPSSDQSIAPPIATMIPLEIITKIATHLASSNVQTIAPPFALMIPPPISPHQLPDNCHTETAKRLIALITCAVSKPHMDHPTNAPCPVPPHSLPHHLSQQLLHNLPPNDPFTLAPYSRSTQLAPSKNQQITPL